MGDSEVIVSEGNAVSDKADFSTSLSRGLTLLQCFSATHRELSSRQLVELTGFSRQTVFRITNTLRQQGLLTYSESRYTFMLTPRVLRLTASLLARLSIRQIALPFMRRLADEANSSVVLSTPDADELLVVQAIHSATSGVHRPDIGTRLSQSRTAPGIIFLLSQPQELRQQRIRAAKDVDTARGVALERALRDAERSLAEKGCFLWRSELQRETISVAAPLRSNLDGQLYVFSASVLAIDADEAAKEKLSLHFLSLLRQIQAATGEDSTYEPVVLPAS